MLVLLSQISGSKLHQTPSLIPTWGSTWSTHSNIYGHCDSVPSCGFIVLRIRNTATPQCVSHLTQIITSKLLVPSRHNVFKCYGMKNQTPCALLSHLTTSYLTTSPLATLGPTSWCLQYHYLMNPNHTPRNVGSRIFISMRSHDTTSYTTSFYPSTSYITTSYCTSYLTTLWALTQPPFRDMIYDIPYWRLQIGGWYNNNAVVICTHKIRAKESEISNIKSEAWPKCR